MQVKDLSGSTLAYIGDAVWSLLVREHLVQLGYGKAKDLQQRSVHYVSAKAQARFYHLLQQNEMLTQSEEEIFRRGRNYKSDSSPKNTDIQTYRLSTGFEALVGYLHMEHQKERLNQIWDFLKTTVEE